MAACGHGGTQTAVAPAATELDRVFEPHWATGRRVSLRLDADQERIEGWMTTVAATDAYVRVGRVHVPLERVLSVHHPSRLADSTMKGGAWARPARHCAPQSEALWAT